MWHDPGDGEAEARAGPGSAARLRRQMLCCAGERNPEPQATRSSFCGQDLAPSV